jgi:hypothetical protein
MIKLSKKQIEALDLLREVKTISKNDNRIHNNTMNALYFKGYIKCPRYVNGEFWELTDKGCEYFKIN